MAGDGRLDDGRRKKYGGEKDGEMCGSEAESCLILV